MPRSFCRLVVSLALVLPFAGAASPAVEFGNVAFVDVNVLPMHQRATLAHQTVLVRGTRIVALGPAGEIEVPADAVSIDGRGRYLMPGVAEMHGHYPQNVDSQLTHDMLFMYVANGVLMVRGMQGGPQHLPLRYAIERREVLGPRLWVSAPMMAGMGGRRSPPCRRPSGWCARPRPPGSTT